MYRVDHTFRSNLIIFSYSFLNTLFKVHFNLDGLRTQIYDFIGNIRFLWESQIHTWTVDLSLISGLISSWLMPAWRSTRIKPSPPCITNSSEQFRYWYLCLRLCHYFFTMSGKIKLITESLSCHANIYVYYLRIKLLWNLEKSEKYKDYKIKFKKKNIWAFFFANSGPPRR